MPGHICIQSWNIPPSTAKPSRHHPHQVIHPTLLRYQGSTTITLASIFATILHPPLLVGGPAPGVAAHLHLHLLQSVSLQTSLGDTSLLILTPVSSVCRTMIAISCVGRLVLSLYS